MPRGVTVLAIGLLAAIAVHVCSSNGVVVASGNDGPSTIVWWQGFVDAIGFGVGLTLAAFFTAEDQSG
jgi:hypothetical protein